VTNKSKEITYFSLFLQVLFGCISPDMCIAYTLVLFFGSLYMQVKQGFIHDNHEDYINGKRKKNHRIKSLTRQVGKKVTGKKVTRKKVTGQKVTIYFFHIYYTPESHCMYNE
jgi:hypothetical protein